MKEYHVEVDWCSVNKNNNAVCGDTILVECIKAEDRIISVLADGLGSGIKANVLSSMTSAMAIKCVSSEMDIRQVAETIMKTLPECSVRKIAYSTFIVFDIRSDGFVQVIEYSTPSSLVLRAGKLLPLTRQYIEFDTKNTYENRVSYYSFRASRGDRIVAYSDGVTQAGIGTSNYPFGWGEQLPIDYIQTELTKNRDMSSRDLSQAIVTKSNSIDAGSPKDDTSCLVHYFRSARKLLVVSGPPHDKSRDSELMTSINEFEGAKIICGGTTANIVAFQMNKPLKMAEYETGGLVPPASLLSGFELVTEGCITLSRLIDLLEGDFTGTVLPSSVLGRLRKQIIESDSITFLVGTKVNEAHQDPRFLSDLDLRKNIVKRLGALLEKKYVKLVTTHFI
ncbi:MAG: serine/threonine-protein phosphatase [Fibrobacterales bacterium]